MHVVRVHTHVDVQLRALRPELGECAEELWVEHGGALHGVLQLPMLSVGDAGEL